jgi:hypothetical protein
MTSWCGARLYKWRKQQGGAWRVVRVDFSSPLRACCPPLPQAAGTAAACVAGECGPLPACLPAGGDAHFFTACFLVCMTTSPSPLVISVTSPPLGVVTFFSSCTGVWVS